MKITNNTKISIEIAKLALNRFLKTGTVIHNFIETYTSYIDANVDINQRKFLSDEKIQRELNKLVKNMIK